MAPSRELLNSSLLQCFGHVQYSPAKAQRVDADNFWPLHFPDETTPQMRGALRVLLIGAQGGGKTSLFNKLTGSHERTSAGRETCTRVNVCGNCPEPFSHVEVVDTPGSAAEELVHYDDSFQLREAFIRKTVNLIVVVCACPTETRETTVIQALKPIDRIMGCHTFNLDQQGVRNQRRHGKYEKTKVLLAMTFRDRFLLDPDEWAGYVEQMRQAYSWIGPAVFVDQHVPLNNLLGNIIVPAMCMDSRDYNIPMVEFCSRFPISRPLSDLDQFAIASAKIEFDNGMTVARAKLNETTQKRVLGGHQGQSSFVDAVGPTLDCILRFLDDIYEAKTLAALGVLEGLRVQDLWNSTDTVVLTRRVEKWNAIKSHFGEAFENNKRLIQQSFPTQPLDAIYKKCPHCQAVYVKPIGCDFGTTCGRSAGGSDTLPFTYDYIPHMGTFKILRNTKMGAFETTAYDLRRRFQTMQTTHARHFYGTHGLSPDPSEAPHKLGPAGFEKGCGRDIRWDTMTPLTIDELKKHGLVPPLVMYAVTISDTAGTNLASKVESIRVNLDLAKGSVVEVVDAACETMGLVGSARPATFAARVTDLEALLQQTNTNNNRQKRQKTT